MRPAGPVTPTNAALLFCDTLTGVGASIIGTENEAILTRLVPYNAIGPDLAVASATEEDGTSDTWWLQVHGICADSVDLGGFFQLTYSHESERDSEGPNNATVNCPPGKHVIGAGGEVIGGANSVVLDDIEPSGDLHSVHAAAYETGPYGDTWSVKAYAICV
jgi:hypothetical protein